MSNRLFLEIRDPAVVTVFKELSLNFHAILS